MFLRTLTVEERRAQCFADAGSILAKALLKVLASDPREAAERAYVEGGPSVAEIEQQIIKMQAEKRASLEVLESRG